MNIFRNKSIVDIIPYENYIWSSFKENQFVYHAGTKINNGEIVTNGGRVIAVTSLNSDIKSALSDSNELAGTIDFDGKFYRRDIGLDLLRYENE